MVQGADKMPAAQAAGNRMASPEERHCRSSVQQVAPDMTTATGSRSGRELLSWTPIVGASLALVWIVPENPLAHLDDPSHWGVIGYVLTVWRLVALRSDRLDRPSGAHRILIGFLIGMPIIYLADWVRFGGSLGYLWVEVGGALLYWTIAAAAVVRSYRVLSAGIAGHALWDLLHLGTADYVPEWYAFGCALVDVAVGLFVILNVWAIKRGT